MNSLSASQLEILIKKSTNNTLLVPDYNLFDEICDMINLNNDLPKEFSVIVSKQLLEGNPTTQLYSLELTEIACEKCNPPFFARLNSPEFTNAIKTLSSKSLDNDVKASFRSLLNYLLLCCSTNKSKYPNLYSFYLELEAKLKVSRIEAISKTIVEETNENIPSRKELNQISNHNQITGNEKEIPKILENNVEDQNLFSENLNIQKNDLRNFDDIKMVESKVINRPTIQNNHENEEGKPDCRNSLNQNSQTESLNSTETSSPKRFYFKSQAELDSEKVKNLYYQPTETRIFDNFKESPWMNPVHANVQVESQWVETKAELHPTLKAKLEILDNAFQDWETWPIDDNFCNNNILQKDLNNSSPQNTFNHPISQNQTNQMLSITSLSSESPTTNCPYDLNFRMAALPQVIPEVTSYFHEKHFAFLDAPLANILKSN